MTVDERLKPADRHGSTLHVKLLDWTQVFHKLHSQAVPQALARHGVSPEFITLVEAIYRCPIHSPGRRTNQLATFTGQFGDSAGLPAFPLLVPGGARHDHGRRRRGPPKAWLIFALALQPKPAFRLGIRR